MALGYTPAQIAPLIGLQSREVTLMVERAATRVGAPDWKAAAAMLARRGLISVSRR